MGKTRQSANLVSDSNITIDISNDRVGIGTTNPSTKLQVDGDITASSATFTGNVSVAGTITYEDVTNVDSVGLVTARSGAHVFGNLGVGTANPSETLTVIGVVTATSYRGDGSQLTGVGGESDITSSLFS